MKFYKPRVTKVLEKQTEMAEDVLKMEAYGEQICINSLPSCARLCLNIIVLPDQGSCKMLKKDVTEKFVHINAEKESRTVNFTRREGLIFGSCQVSLFDENFTLR